MGEIRKFLLFIPIITILIMIISCDDSCGYKNDELTCSLEQMQDRFANTSCIAEELVAGCSNILCKSTGEPAIRASNFVNDCRVVDCETLACDTIVVGTPGGEMLVPGFLTELVINEMNELPSGLFIDTPFDCIFIAVN